MKKAAKNISLVLYPVFVVFVLFIGIFTIFSVFDIGGVKVLNVQSGSMEPAILSGSTIIIQRSQDYQKSDVITYDQISIEGSTAKKTTTTHRIVSVNEETGEYTTKGDANYAQDGSVVAQKDIVGKVVFTIPFLGYVSNFAKSPLGFILLILIPGVSIIVNEVVGLTKRKDPDDFRIGKISIGKNT